MSDSPNNDNRNRDNKKFNPFNEFQRQTNGKNQNNLLRNILLWFLLAGGLFSVYFITQATPKAEWPITFTEYKKLMEQDLIVSAKVTKSQLNDFEFHGELKQPVTIVIDGKPRDVRNFITKLGVLDNETEKNWETKNISWTYEEGESGWWSALQYILPWVLLIGLYIFFIKRMQGGGTKGIFSFGKARMRTLSENAPKITFEDVAGADEAKFELIEVIEFLREPDKFKRLGGKIPKGVLLLGPPGTGKTLLARAVAGEAQAPFFSMSGADFVEMFVGVGASRVRDLFDQAKKNSPCIVFIDEIDAVGRHRGAGLGGGHDEREQTLNQLLIEMDGFEQNSGVIVIAATNRPDVLDPALLRPGRFDRHIVVDRPDIKGREGIFKVHTKSIPLGTDVDLQVLARGTPGLAGADIANIVNEAALFASRRNSDKVTMYDFENAKDKVLMGIERKSMVISEKEKEMTSYHEMGHALAGKLVPYSDPVHKVTIIPRGRALGVTSYLPTEEFYAKSRDYFESLIIRLLAGRAAEKIVFNKLSTGASNDLMQATKIARKMVCEWGMSDAVGPVSFAGHQEEVFLGKDISQPRDHSEQTAQLIDTEVRRILMDGMEKAETLLNENIELLHKTSKILLEREVLDGEELDMIIRGETLPPISKQAMNALKTIKFNAETLKTSESSDKI